MDVKKTLPPAGTPENQLASVERLRRQAEEFQDTIDEEVRKTRVLLDALLVREATRRGD